MIDLLAKHCSGQHRRGANSDSAGSAGVEPRSYEHQRSEDKEEDDSIQPNSEGRLASVDHRRTQRTQPGSLEG